MSVSSYERYEAAINFGVEPAECDAMDDNETTGHKSDCSVYNMPAYPAELCDCGFLEVAIERMGSKLKAYPFDTGILHPADVQAVLQGAIDLKALLKDVAYTVETIALHGADPGRNNDPEGFYRIQLRNCISLAARTVEKLKRKP